MGIMFSLLLILALAALGTSSGPHDQHAASPEGTWFACASGVAPCLALHLLEVTKWDDFCVTVHITPDVLL